MVPGVNGGGRQTGTVPKTKAHNDSTRELQHSSMPNRRHFSFSHMNNNLASLDWQSMSDVIPQSRSRKESNTSASRYSEPIDTPVDETAVCPDNNWLSSLQHPQMHYPSEDEMMGRWEDRRHKSNNIPNLPEHSQVNSRLHQIRDYISQTTSLMDRLRASGNPGAENGLSEMNYSRSSQQASNSATSPDVNRQRNCPNQPTGSVPKSSDATTRRNELKMKVEESQRKLLELREHQATLMALKQKAQDQLKEARAAQLAEIIGCGVSSDCTTSEVTQLQNKLEELQMKKTQMDQMVAQFASYQNAEPESVISSNVLSGAIGGVDISGHPVGGGGEGGGGDGGGGDESIEAKIAELAALKEQLSHMQSVLARVPVRNSSQESEVEDEAINLRAQQGKQDNRTQAVTHSSPGPVLTTAQQLQAKTIKFQEAKARLHHLQELLTLVEEFRDSGKPVPEKVLILLNSSNGALGEEDCGSLLDLDECTNQARPQGAFSSNSSNKETANSNRPEQSLQDLYQEVAAAVAADKQRQPNKPNNTSAKLRSKTQQLEEWMRKDDLMSSINTDIHSQSGYSYQETPTIATWGGSTHDTIEDRDNTHSPDYSSDDGGTENGAEFVPLPVQNLVNKPSSTTASHKDSVVCANVVRDGLDSASVTGANVSVSVQTPQNVWRKQSTGSGASIPHHGVWTPSSSYNAQPHTRQENLCGTEELVVNPDNSWVVQQIAQLQSQLQHMCQNVAEKHHNPMLSSPGNMWMPPYYSQNGPAAFGGYSHFVSSQQQQLPINQLLINSLNQCCQLIWHQQCELMGLKDTLNTMQQQQQSQHQRGSAVESDLQQVDQGSDSHSNLGRAAPPPPSGHTNRNIVQSNSSPVISLPHYFYPPYGNNLNFEPFQHSSPVGTFLSSPAGTLNNQVPPGNRANNYWDNFRSYSRQNLLSVRSKCNEQGLPLGERERTQERDVLPQPHPHPPHPPDVMTFNLSHHKEKLNTHQTVTPEQPSHSAGPQEQQPSRCSANKPSQVFRHNNCSDPSTQPDVSRELELRTGPESERTGACKKVRSETRAKEQQTPSSATAVDGPAVVNRSWNSLDEGSTVTKGKRHLRNTALTEDLPRNSNCKRKTDCKINSINRAAENNSERLDSLEEAFYSEVAALISVNERQLNYLLQLFRDLKHLNSDSDRQAALLTIHNLANRASGSASAAQQVGCCMKEEQQNENLGLEEPQQDVPSCQESGQPRNIPWGSSKDTASLPLLPNSCNKLDWEVRGILVAMLPFLKAHLSETCGPGLLEAICNLVLQLVPPQNTQGQLDALLESALLKFQGCRLRDICDELVNVVGDVLISEITFLRLMSSVNSNNPNEANGEDILVEEGGEEEEEDEEEGAVGGVAVSTLPADQMMLHEQKPTAALPSLATTNQPAANQMVRCTKSDTVSEADLAEADQSRHPGGTTGSGDCVNGTVGTVELDNNSLSPDERREPLMHEEADGIHHHSMPPLSLSHQRSTVSPETDWAVDQVMPCQLNGPGQAGAHDELETGLGLPHANCSNNTSSDVGQI